MNKSYQSTGHQRFHQRYKRNAIISDLNSATRMPSFSADEMPKIK